MSYSKCKITKKETGTGAANYKFECEDSEGNKKEICVKGQTINDNQAIQRCKNGEFDSESDCANWD